MNTKPNDETPQPQPPQRGGRPAWRAAGHTRRDDAWRDGGSAPRGGERHGGEPHGDERHGDEPHALCTWAASIPGQSPVIAAISCGHDDARPLRGGVGAALALESVQQVLTEHDRLIAWAPRHRQLTLIREDLPTRIVSAWLHKVDQHLRTHPFDLREHEALARLADAGSDAADDSMPRWAAYGAGVQAAMITDGSLVLLQLGDGTSLVIDEDGVPLLDDTGPARRPSASLARRDAARCFRTAQIPLPSRKEAGTAPFPHLVLLGCPAYARQYATRHARMSAAGTLAATLDGGTPGHPCHDSYDSDRLADWLACQPLAADRDDMTVVVIHPTGQR